MITAYISIGNSDDKLTQARWAEFVTDVWALLDRSAERMHGAWYSAPAAPWQNACWCIELGDEHAGHVKNVLSRLAARYGQDSIAFAVAQTEFLSPA